MNPARAFPGHALLAAFLLATPAHAADVAALAKPCEDCHGKNGVSQAEDVPTIAGISAPVHSDTMQAFKDKSRPCRSSKYRHGDTSRPETDMCAVAAKLGDADVEALAGYFAAQPFVAAKQAFDPAKAAAGKKLHARDCAKCHTEGGSLADDDASILAGQHLKYLQQSLADFRSGKRDPGKKMGDKLKPLSDADVEALAHYFASEQ